jgi:rhamnosyl/mannosyltransferase
MKIFQINKFYAPIIGGIEKIVQDIAEGLIEKTDMSVLTCQPKGKRSAERYNGVQVLRSGSIGTFLSMPVSLDFFRLYREMSQDADIIQLHSPFPLGDLAVFFFRRKGKLAVWWHSDIVRQKIFLALLTPIIHHTLKRADVIIVAAQENIKSSMFLSRYADKCVCIPYGLDFNAYPETTAFPKFLDGHLTDKGCKKLLFAGRLVYYKGVDILVKAMKNIQNAELFIVGNGSLEKKLKSYVRREGMGDKVHFMGTLSRDKLLAAYSSCDVFVFPSVAKSEAFGLCQLEAMFYGKPVINTLLPTAVPFVSINGETGITVPCSDKNELANAIMALTQRDDMRAQYGINAARRVRELFNQTDMLNTLFSLYIEMLKGDNK